MVSLLLLPLVEDQTAALSVRFSDLCIHKINIRQECFVDTNHGVGADQRQNWVKGMYKAATNDRSFLTTDFEI